MGGYKGFGLAFMAEVLSGVLTGSPYGVNARSHDNVRGGIGHLVIAIDVGFFLDVDEFANRVLDLCQQLANNTSADVYLPGQKEYRLRNERLQTGIPLSNELVESLRSLTSYLEMASPDWLKTH
jgi:LDH2 family malate/lactate/ureidoglycolate dehydrogenase